MAAKKAPMETLTLADIGLDASTVGLANAWSQVNDFAERAAKAKGTIITDDGHGAEKIEEFLVTQKFI
jgi:electron transfer flavoprotein beta subunit